MSAVKESRWYGIVDAGKPYAIVREPFLKKFFAEHDASKHKFSVVFRLNTTRDKARAALQRYRPVRNAPAKKAGKARGRKTGPRFWRVRVAATKLFTPRSFRTIKLGGGHGHKAIIGRLKGKAVTRVQAYLVARSKVATLAKAREHVAGLVRSGNPGAGCAAVGKNGPRKPGGARRAWTVYVLGSDNATRPYTVMARDAKAAQREALKQAVKAAVPGPVKAARVDRVGVL